MINKTINYDTKVEDLKNGQEILKSHSGEVKKGSNKIKSKEQKKTTQNLKGFTTQETRLLIF